MQIIPLYQEATGYFARGEYSDARRLYEEVLRHDPTHAASLHDLGLIHFSLGMIGASELLQRAIDASGDNPVYANNFGVILSSEGRLDEAKDTFTRAIDLDPEYADAWANLGMTLLNIGQNSNKCETALRRALQLAPKHRDAVIHLVQLLEKDKRHRERAELLETLLELTPADSSDYPAILVQLAQSLADDKQYERAIPRLERLLQSYGNDANLHRFYACCLAETGRIDEARTFFRKGASLPGGKSIWRWKHLGYCPVYFEDTDEIDRYWNTLDKELDEALAESSVYDWREVAEEGAVPSFQLEHLGRCCRTVKEKFSKLYEPSFPFKRPKLTFSSRKSGKIRVGFVASPGHEGGFIRSMHGIMRRIDPKRFDILLFHHENMVSFRNYDNAPFRTISFDDRFERTVEIFRQAECDILYHWKAGADRWTTFLPMTWPAPIQCTGWTTHGSSGMSCIDYMIFSRAAEVPEIRERYTEKLFVLETLTNWEYPAVPILSSGRAEFGLPEEGALYFCPFRPAKYHPEFDFYLRDILRADPRGRIVLLRLEGTSEEEKFRQRMRRVLGGELFERLIFMPKLTPERYNALGTVMTVELTFPYFSGSYTSYDAFAHGIPCVVQAEFRPGDIYAKAFYDIMGIDGPVVTNRREYVEQAVRLGTDSAYRESISRLIRERLDRILGHDKIVREYERFFEQAVADGPVA